MTMTVAIVMCSTRELYPYPLQGGYWKFQGWGGAQKPNALKKSMNPNRNFRGIRWGDICLINKRCANTACCIEIII